jgi:hypothetical protein
MYEASLNSFDNYTNAVLADRPGRGNDTMAEAVTRTTVCPFLVLQDAGPPMTASYS